MKEHINTTKRRLTTYLGRVLGVCDSPRRERTTCGSTIHTRLLGEVSISVIFNYRVRGYLAGGKQRFSSTAIILQATAEVGVYMGEWEGLADCYDKEAVSRYKLADRTSNYKTKVRIPCNLKIKQIGYSETFF